MPVLVHSVFQVKTQYNGFSLLFIGSYELFVLFLFGTFRSVPLTSDDILERCGNNITVYFTFDWKSEEVKRICFGIVAENKSELPDFPEDELNEFIDNPPSFNHTGRYIYSISISAESYYIKIEPDYSGTMIDLMLDGVATVGKIMNA